jgi:iron complex outermembrane receptor protein
MPRSPTLPLSQYHRLSVCFGVGLLGAGLIAQTAPAPATRPPAKAAVTEEEKDKDAALKLEQFVVTGVFNATEASKATTAISVVDYDTVAMQVPLSADDLLLEVAGVFVNSSLGEIRGMVYSRGISADSADGSSGHNYVSIQEDGLPITNVNFGNYGPGYFNRPDATLQRVEAVRGGSASITTSNSPGGAFNYLTRSGASRFGGEVRTRVGIEGRWSPTYRTDLAWGSPIGKTGWTYNAGAFYRYAEGHRPAIGYPMNDGFVLRGNLFKDYGAGSVKIYSKYMDDRNHWYEYLLARNPQDPKQYPGLSRFSTNLFPKTSFQFPREAEDRFATFDSTDAVRSRQRLIGVDWSHELPSGWSINHNVKFSAQLGRLELQRRRHAPQPRLAEFLFSTMGIPVQRRRHRHQRPRAARHSTASPTARPALVLAEVTSNGSYTVNANALSPPRPDRPLREPAQPATSSANSAFWTNVGRVANEHLDEVMENLTVTKPLPEHDLHRRRLLRLLRHLGPPDPAAAAPPRRSPSSRCRSPFTWIPADRRPPHPPAPPPPTLAISSPAGNGQPVQLTNPEGFTHTGVGLTYVRDEGVARQLAYFFGHKWDIEFLGWGFDWGFRQPELPRPAASTADRLAEPARQLGPDLRRRRRQPVHHVRQPLLRSPIPPRKWRYDKRVRQLLLVGRHQRRASTTPTPSTSATPTARRRPTTQFFRTYTSQFRLDEPPPAARRRVDQWELGYRYKRKSLDTPSPPRRSGAASPTSTATPRPPRPTGCHALLPRPHLQHRSRPTASSSRASYRLTEPLEAAHRLHRPEAP